MVSRHELHEFINGTYFLKDVVEEEVLAKNV